MTWNIAALYQFTRFDDPAALKQPLEQACLDHGVCGTLLLAREGINGTIAAATRAGLDAALAHIRSLPGCAGLEWKESQADEQPFFRMKVRLKREIVTMGEPEVDPAGRVGRYVEAADWNDFIRRNDVVMIDTRNDYEISIGTFDGAIDPQTQSFREFPEWWREHAKEFEGKKLAMFCTGGIRCEKATSWLVGQGVDEVFHLKGGILKYLETVPAEDSRWRGECFVFDQRVSVGHGLTPGELGMCHACRRPLTAEDQQSEHYRQGISCPYCIDQYSDADRTRFAERERQSQMAAAKGERHLGQARDKQ
jgi:UPF0176 protein